MPKAKRNPIKCDIAEQTQFMADARQKRCVAHTELGKDKAHISYHSDNTAHSLETSFLSPGQVIRPCCRSQNAESSSVIAAVLPLSSFISNYLITGPVALRNQPKCPFVLDAPGWSVSSNNWPKTRPHPFAAA
jgi:hypothetical protein